MDKKISVIIGGTGGIGISTAETLSKQGMQVCICGNENIESAKSKLNGENFDFYKIDLTKKESILEGISSIIEKYGRIDSVVYSVSDPVKNKRVGNLTWEDFQEKIDIQIKGLFLIVQTMLSKLENPKTKFVIVLTEYCIGKPPTGIAPYITAKYGLMGFTKAMAAELIKNNFSFNMVSPGMVDTELLSTLPPKLIEIVTEQNPMKRIAKPKDVAEVISFLVSEEANYLNGINIPINGGNIFT